MLNELYYLAGILDPKKFKLQDWHDKFQLIPNNSYHVFISQSGAVTGLDLMSKDLVSCLRKWEPSNGYSFPCFNIQPLYRIIDEDRKALCRKWQHGDMPINVEELKKWCAEPLSRNCDVNSEKLVKCLDKISKELHVKCGEIEEKFIAIKKLFERVAAWGSDCTVKFYSSLESYIWQTIENGNASLLLPMLVHEGSLKKRAKEDSGSVSVFLDVPDFTEYPVASEKTIKWINERLLQPDVPQTKKSERQLKDAYGFACEGNEKKLPDVKLPKINKVILRAMSSESPCQYRYGTIDAQSFCIGSESRKRMKKALSWLGDKSREGQTWGQVDKSELLFAYPTILPETLPGIAACLGARKLDDTEARFAKYAEEVIECLSGVAPTLKDIELRVFSLRKMDKARTKVVFHRNYSAQRLADAAQEWRRGCGNIPAIRIKAWAKEKGKTIWVDPAIPFPLQVAECLNRIWQLDGISKSEIKSIPKAAGIELLLDEEAANRQVPHLLTVAVQNSRGIFFSMGNALHCGDAIKVDKLNKQKQLMPSILGLLLWKLGIRKESYMKNPPYLVGRILKLADELHALYCKEVRKNNLPPQLIGNALMTAALNSPTQALAQLALRIKPYLGWARTNSTESAGLSRYYLKELGLVENELHNVQLPSCLGDAEKAQLFLGYIANNSQNDENTNA